MDIEIKYVELFNKGYEFSNGSPGFDEAMALVRKGSTQFALSYYNNTFEVKCITKRFQTLNLLPLMEAGDTVTSDFASYADALYYRSSVAVKAKNAGMLVSTKALNGNRIRVTLLSNNKQVVE